MVNAKKITSICPARGWRAGFFDEDGIYLEPVIAWVLIGGVIRGVVYTGDCIEFDANARLAGNFLGFIPPGENIPERWKQRVEAEAEVEVEVEAEVEDYDEDPEQLLFGKAGDTERLWLYSRFEQGDTVSRIADDAGMTIGEVWRSLGERRRNFERDLKARKECLRTHKNAGKSHAAS